MGQKEDTDDERANWHWRNSMRPVRFFGLDARAGISFFVLLFYLRPITIFLTIVVTMSFVLFEQRGLAFNPALRTLRTWMIGQKRPAWLSYSRRKMIDFG